MRGLATVLREILAGGMRCTGSARTCSSAPSGHRPSRPRRARCVRRRRSTSSSCSRSTSRARWTRDEQAIQRHGYVEAFRHPEVLDADPLRPLRPDRRHLRRMGRPGCTARHRAVDADRGRGHGRRLRRRPRGEAAHRRIRGTSISGGTGLRRAAVRRPTAIEGLRRVIDISGDGPNNAGAPVVPARDAVLGARASSSTACRSLIKAPGYFGHRRRGSRSPTIATASSAAPARS